MPQKIGEALPTGGAARIDRLLQPPREAIFSGLGGRILFALLPPAKALEERCNESTI